MSLGGSIEGGGDINSLGGVQIISPTNGQTLVYNSIAQLWENSSGGGATGYQTVQGNGTSVAQETTVNFIGAGVTVVDNPGSMRTDVTITNVTGYQTIENLGTAVAQETTFNFATTGITAVDNMGLGRTDISLAAPLVDVAGLTPTIGKVIVGNGTHFVDGTAANISDVYAAVNYTPTSATVDGNLQGIDNVLGTITPGIFPWTVITVNTTMAANHGYFTNNAAGLTLTIPLTSGVGDTYKISNLTTGTITIAQNAGQNIRFGTLITTTGTGGNLTLTNIGDGLSIVCSVANTSYQIVPGAIGSNIGVT